MRTRLLSSPHRSDSGPGRLARCEGILGRSLDGVVTIGEGTVVWPAEIELRLGPRFELINTDSGAVVAREGDLIVVGGGLVPTTPSDTGGSEYPNAFWVNRITHVEARSAPFPRDA